MMQTVALAVSTSSVVMESLVIVDTLGRLRPR